MSSVETDIVKINDFQTFLQKFYNIKQLEVIDVQSTKLLPLGENYGSLMIKLNVTISKDKNAEKESLHFVAKTMNPSDRPLVNWSEILWKEIFMYTDIIPAYQKLERDMGIEPILNFVPKYIGHRFSLGDEVDIADKDSMLVLENLKERNFYTCDRRIGMDLEHASKALSSLAEFHALGVALKQHYPEHFEKLSAQAQLLGVNFEEIDEGFDFVLKIFHENACFEKNLPVIMSSFSDIKNGRILVSRINEPWVTIIHGDFWTNNIMFHKNSKGCVDDVKFVDFQVYVLNSPIRDLTNFLCGGNIDELTKVNHMEELISLYYNAYIQWLRRLRCDCKLFSREAFDRELKKQAINIFPWCALMARFTVFEIKEEQKSSTILSDILRSKSSTALIKKFQDLIDLYEKMRWF